MSAKIEAIDVHVHLGQYHGAGGPRLDRFQSGDAKTVIARARQAGAVLRIVSSLKALLPRLKGNPLAGNREVVRETERHKELMFWAVLDPRRKDNFSQVKDLLKHPKCAGLKIHPEEHGYPIRQYGKIIFEFAAKHGAVIQSHSGERNSRPEDFVQFANAYKSVKIIVAHLGCGWDNDPAHQVRAIQRCRHGNMFTDTSSAMSLTPGLLEWAVRVIGAERILYGSDSPLYVAALQRARVDLAGIHAREKRRILRENALHLLPCLRLGLERRRIFT